MKIALFAAAALIAAPAIAQVTTPTPPDAGQAGTTPDGQMGTMSDQNSMGTTSPTMGTTNPDQSTMNQGTMGSQPMTTGSGEPMGGYQPDHPAMQGSMQPGATVRYEQSMSPSEAYPAPAPMSSYPVCRQGQYDHCRQKVSPK